MTSGIVVSQIHWGDLPTWLTFIATASAVAAAVYAGFKAAALLDVERKRDCERREVEQRSQASRVAAWARPAHRSAFGAQSPYFSSRVEAVAVNNSDQPVYGVAITWWHGNSEIRTDAADLVPPGQERAWGLPEPEFEAVLGKSGASAVIAHEAMAAEISTSVAERLRIEISFTDAENRRWSRGRDGILQRV